MQISDRKLKIENMKKLKDLLQKFEFKNYFNKSQEIIGIKDNEILDCNMPGYIITIEGIIIPVVEGELHSDVVDRYLIKYYGKEWISISKEAKAFYLPYLWKCNAVMYMYDGDNNDPTSTFFMPNEFEKLSSIQKEIIQNLEKSLVENNYKINYFNREDIYFRNPYNFKRMS